MVVGSNPTATTNSMIPVDPNTRSTLVLTKNYQPTGRLFTARAAIRHMMNGRVKGIDAAGNCVSWNGADVERADGPLASMNWEDLTVTLYPDQPCLRSAPNGLTGNETQWPVPTIVVCTYHFGYHGRKGSSVSTRALYNLYRGQCQYCLEKITFADATRDHVYPRSKGGSDDDFNVVLACRSCNSAKDSSYPYLDANGNQVRPRILNPAINALEGIQPRPEWRQFLYLE